MLKLKEPAPRHQGHLQKETVSQKPSANMWLINIDYLITVFFATNQLLTHKVHILCKDKTSVMI